MRTPAKGAEGVIEKRKNNSLLIIITEKTLQNYNYLPIFY